MILAPRWTIFAAGIGFALVLNLILLAKVSVMEAGLFLPIGVALLLIVLYAGGHALRKRRFIALGADGRGEVPRLAHLLAQREARRFDIGETVTRYDPPYILFEPPLETDSGERIDKLFLQGRHVHGGAGRIEAFAAFANSLHGRQTEGAEE